MKKSAKSPLTSDHLDLRPVPVTAEHVLDAGYAQLAEEFNSEAHRAERRVTFDAERTAALAEATNPAVIDEEGDWDKTTGDGID
jgi:hypothetical protein